jgi:hypothetical protein
MGKLKNAIAQNLGGGDKDKGATVKYAPMAFTACDALVEAPLAAPLPSPRAPAHEQVSGPESAPALTGGASVFEGAPLCPAPPAPPAPPLYANPNTGASAGGGGIGVLEEEEDDDGSLDDARGSASKRMSI